MSADFGLSVSTVTTDSELDNYSYILGERVFGCYTNNGEEPPARGNEPNFDFTGCTDINRLLYEGGINNNLSIPPKFVSNDVRTVKWFLGVNEESETRLGIGMSYKYVNMYLLPSTDWNVAQAYTNTRLGDTGGGVLTPYTGQLENYRTYLVIQRTTDGAGVAHSKLYAVQLEPTENIIKTCVLMADGLEGVTPEPVTPDDPDIPEDPDDREPDGSYHGSIPSVPVAIPDLPSIGAGQAGCSLFHTGSIDPLISYMWGTDGFLDAVRKLLGDETPYECIVAVNLFPYGEALVTGASEQIHIGNVNTYLTAETCQQFCKVEFPHTFIAQEYFNCLDYAPYTTVEIQLPFIGRVKIPTDIVMGREIGVTYHCDVVSGGITAYLSYYDNGVGYVFQVEGGSCISKLPISAKTADATQQALSSAISAGLSAVSLGTASVATGNTASLGGLVMNEGDNAMRAKDGYTTYSNLNFSNGYLGWSNPVLFINRPLLEMPKDYNTYIGYPASTEVTLSSCSGYTRVKEINLGVPTATPEELKEIESILKSGVII